MKRALINNLEPGRICDVVEVGSEFDVCEGFTWIDCPNEVSTTHKYDVHTGEFIPFDILRLPGFAEEGYKVARAIGYTSVGNQLDMIYKELMATGSLSIDGPWATHIATIKSEIPKDDPEAVLEWNKRYVEAQNNNI